jgi:hypothetical protein
MLSVGVSPLGTILSQAASTYSRTRMPDELTELESATHDVGLAAVRERFISPALAARFREVEALFSSGHDPKVSFAQTVCAIGWTLTSVPSAEQREKDVLNIMERIDQAALPDNPDMAALDMYCLRKLLS